MAVIKYYASLTILWIIFFLAVLPTCLFCTKTDQDQECAADCSICFKRPELIYEREFTSGIHFIHRTDSVLIVGLADHIMGLQVDNFQELWMIPFLNIRILSPCLSEGILYVSGRDSSSNQNIILSIDTRTGEILDQWIIHSQFSAPLVCDSLMIVGLRQGGIEATLSSDSTLWNTGIENWWPRVLSESDGVIVASWRRSGNSWTTGSTPRSEAICGLDADTGEELWFRELTTFKVDHLMLNSGMVFIPLKDSLIAINIHTGRTAWNMDIKSVEQIDSIGETILAMGGNEILLIDAVTGEHLHSGYLRGWSNAISVLTEEKLYLRNGGQIICLSYPELQPMWAISIGGYGSILVADERLYCSCSTRFYVLESDDQ